MITFAVPSLNKREFSSAGSEHLPYKQRVGGSNPSTPTTISHSVLSGFFCFCACGICIANVEQMTVVILLLCNVCLVKQACHAIIPNQVAFGNALHQTSIQTLCLLV